MRAGGMPLDGVRVLDLSGSYAGPTASMYLADMGADVIKVERPGGDEARGWGPPFAGETSAWFLSANRNKRSLGLDLRAPEGIELIYRVLPKVDVLVANIMPTKLLAGPLSPERVRAAHPRLVYCVISGFGLNGPAAGSPAYDLIAQARSGLMSVTGPLGGSPERVGTALSDTTTGIVAAFATVSALYRSARSGQGELVDVSLLESDLALMAPRIASYLAGEPEPAPCGGTDSVLAVYQRFPTADDPIIIAVGNDAMWERFCTAAGLPELLDGRTKTNEQRRQRRHELVEAISDRLRTAPAQVWLDRLAQANIPVAPISYLSDVVRDEQILARGSIASAEMADGHEASFVRPPWRLGADGGQPPRTAPPPRGGANTVEVLGELGLEQSEIDQLFSAGAIWSESK